MNSKASENVKILRLEPMTVASHKGFGPGPEIIAWDGLITWMKTRGILIRGSRFFGFNNPNPTPGSPNYGYEQWLALDAAPTNEDREAALKSGVELKAFTGGLYAVSRHSGSPEKLPLSWAALKLWVERSVYRSASHQWLEGFINPEIMQDPEPDWEKAEIDMYYPISE